MPENGHNHPLNPASSSVVSPIQPTPAIDPNEAAQLAGYQPEQTEQLLETEYRLVQEHEGGDTRPVHESPFPRLAAVALPVGLMFLAGIGIWFGLLAPKSKKVPEIATAPTPTPTLNPDNSAELKSQLAFQQQQVKAEKPEPTSKPISTKQKEREAPRRIARSEPSEPRVVERSNPPRESPALVSRAAPIAKPVDVDPIARWNQLAQLGQQQTNHSDESNQTASTGNTIPSPTATQQIVAAATNPGVIPTVRVGFDSNNNSAQQPDADSTIDGGTMLPALNPLLVASRRPISPNSSDAEQRILNERSLEREPMSVAIGTTVPAKVVVPMMADQESKQDLGRFAVELTDDVFATDGRIALPKGTILVTEVSNVEKSTSRVDQSAVAIVYKDQTGNTLQQQIPANSLLVRGADNQPLIVQSSEDGAGIVAGQDLLVGGLSALGKVGTLLNQPNEESFSSFDGPFSSGQTFRRSRKPNIFGASLEGFFGVTADRLRKRADTITDEQYSRPKLMVVKQGEPVSVVFNTFFEIQR